MENELYNNESRQNHAVKTGKYRGLSYIIASCGTHPVAYVKIPKDHYFYRAKDREILYEFPAPCHGGITFVGTPSTIDYAFVEDDIWLGWDYAHAGDFYREGYGKKWTIKEIYEEVKNFVNFLLDRPSNRSIVKSISPDGSITYWTKNWTEDEIDLKHSVETVLEQFGFERED